MNTKFSAVAARIYQRGVTLVELMIAMAISLFMMGAVLYVVTETQVSYRYNEHLSQIQENGRIAVERIAYDARMAGFFGCRRPETIHVTVKANPPPSTGTSLVNAVPLQAYVHPSPQTAFLGTKGVTGSHVLVIRKVSDNPVNLVGNLTSDNANIQIADNRDKFKAGDLLLITDCSVGDLFRATNVSSGGGKVTIAHAASSNTTPKLSKAYGEDAIIMGYVETMYFVMDSGRVNATGSPVYSLYKSENGVNIELAEGVEDLRVLIGVDTDSNRTIDDYVNPSSVTNWRQVVAARVQLLVGSVEDNVTRRTGHQNYVFQDVAVTADDYRMRQPFEVTVALRNRLP